MKAADKKECIKMILFLEVAMLIVLGVLRLLYMPRYYNPITIDVVLYFLLSTPVAITICYMAGPSIEKWGEDFMKD
jgi:hypothetical protein